jgi:hypothetical protein
MLAKIMFEFVIAGHSLTKCFEDVLARKYLNLNELFAVIMRKYKVESVFHRFLLSFCPRVEVCFGSYSPFYIVQ